MDLTLPPTAPQLGRYSRYNWDRSSFAVYTLIKINEQSLHTLASKLEEEGLEDYEHVVRIAPNHDFSGKSLQDVLEAHISLLENDVETVVPYGEFNDGDLRWFPTAFIVLTSNDGTTETGRFLFVCADPYDEPDECPMDKFYFGVEDADAMLSGIRLGDEVFADAKEVYGTGYTDAA